MVASTKPPRTRRTWPQRLLLVAGVLLAGACFLAAQGLWEARTVLADLPRIRVASDVLAQSGQAGDPVNFLLIGVDSSEGLDEDDPVRSGRDTASEANGRFLSDTILMVRLDPATGAASVMSIPRDLYVSVPGSTDYKINSTLLIGGVEKLIQTIDANLSIPVNHFVMVDFAGFSSLVELVGGVPVYFPFETRDVGSGLSIEQPGCWVLDGSTALAYVRARTIEENIDGEWVRLAGGAPDLARIARQQEFMVLALEEALQLGAADVGRIREFVQVGAEAVVLDDRLTPGQLLDLADSFRAFDTDTLSTETLPVSPLFNEEGRYLGEALRPTDAEDLLRLFQGRADGVRPSEVNIVVAGGVGSTGRAVEQLAERGFVAAAGAQSEPDRTTIGFAADQLEEAVLVARYLELSPAFEPRSGGDSIELELGPDFGGVRTIPRPESEVIERAQIAASMARQLVAAATTTTVAPVDDSATAGSEETTSTTATSTQSATTTTPRASTTSAVSDGLAPEASTTSTIVRGRPPDGVTCSPLGE